MDYNLQEFSHKRFNILTGEWLLVSPHRAKRPWQGQEEDTTEEKRPTHDEIVIYELETQEQTEK